ncbi:MULTISPECIES: cupin domain-containing protein [Rhodomicrobium]|uniref:cupin domain-containing protein n=1 Tax=Rhodomicrobium TaxID=1068 RepID=UPI001FD97BF9|nr:MULTISPECIES: cupin domain-containing protein [Rhodomicrobium]
MLDCLVPAGFETPRHLHRNDDAIFLIELGTIVLWTPALCRTARRGDVVLLPKQIPHTWRAYGDAAVYFQVTVTPGKFASFFKGIADRSLMIDQIEALTGVASSANWISLARH